MRHEKFFLQRLTGKKGSLLMITYMVIAVFVIFGAIFIVTVGGERRAAERVRMTAVAFNVAEAGIERFIFDLRQDYLNDASPNWDDGDINGMALGPDTSNYLTVSYTGTTLNGASYVVEMKNVAGREDVWVRSTGTIGDETEQVIVYVSLLNLSPWNNAIFAGAGASGNSIGGNVDIRGSVHILGENCPVGQCSPRVELAPTEYAVDLGGTAELIGNNYAGLEAGLVSKVPALGQIVHNGENVYTLNAELRVKHGLVGLSGSATAGTPQTTGNTVKETINASYVTDGFAGTSGSASVHSDNGWSNQYDLGDAVSFPTLSTPYGAYSTYQEYLKANALVINDVAGLAVLDDVTPATVFSRSNGNGSITFDGAGNMTISGIVYVEGGGINMTKDGSNDDIFYSGTGSILVEGHTQIDINLETAGNNSYPTNILAIMTPTTIGFDAANSNVMGLFYAEDTITIAKQTDIMGTIISNYFDMGTNVPSIYQVPATLTNLPAGLIGNEGIYAMKVVAWMRQ